MFGNILDNMTRLVVTGVTHILNHARKLKSPNRKRELRMTLGVGGPRETELIAEHGRTNPATPPGSRHISARAAAIDGELQGSLPGVHQPVFAKPRLYLFFANLRPQCPNSLSALLLHAFSSLQKAQDFCKLAHLANLPVTVCPCALWIIVCNLAAVTWLAADLFPGRA